MPRLKMIDVGLPYKKIMQGSKWVGRVYKNAQGTYTGQIGKPPNRIEVTAANERMAFAEVAARFFGQPSAAALAAHNREVRSHNRALRAPLRRSRDDFMLREIERVLGLRPGSARAANVGTPGGERALRISDEQAAEGEARRIEMGEDDFMPAVRPSLRMARAIVRGEQRRRRN